MCHVKTCSVLSPKQVYFAGFPYAIHRGSEHFFSISLVSQLPSETSKYYFHYLKD